MDKLNNIDKLEKILVSFSVAGMWDWTGWDLKVGTQWTEFIHSSMSHHSLDMKGETLNSSYIVV